MTDDSKGSENSRLLDRAFVDGMGSFLCPLVILASTIYGNAVMSPDTQLRAGWFVGLVVVLPLFVLGMALWCRGIWTLHRLPRFRDERRQRKRGVTATLLLIGLLLHAWAFLRFRFLFLLPLLIFA